MSYADRVFYDQGTRRVNVGPSVITPVCGICGAMLADQQKHDEWHQDITDSFKMLGLTVTDE